jgi:hypothetical protein
VAAIELAAAGSSISRLVPDGVAVLQIGTFAAADFPISTVGPRFFAITIMAILEG